MRHRIALRSPPSAPRSSSLPPMPALRNPSACGRSPGDNRPSRCPPPPPAPPRSPASPRPSVAPGESDSPRPSCARAGRSRPRLRSERMPPVVSVRVRRIQVLEDQQRQFQPVRPCGGVRQGVVRFHPPVPPHPVQDILPLRARFQAVQLADPQFQYSSDSPGCPPGTMNLRTCAPGTGQNFSGAT